MHYVGDVFLNWSVIDNPYARHRVSHEEIALGTRPETIRWRKIYEDKIHTVKI